MFYLLAVAGARKLLIEPRSICFHLKPKDGQGWYYRQRKPSTGRSARKG
jgi:hypothetical protein